MKNHVVALFGSLLLATAACAHEPEALPAPLAPVDTVRPGCPAVQGEPRAVGIAELAADPARFRDMAVSVTGYYYGSFEHSALYATPIRQVRRRSDGIWLMRMDRKLSGKQVAVVGTFTDRAKGHMGQWAGALCVVSAVERSAR